MSTQPPFPTVCQITSEDETDDELISRLANLSNFEYEKIRTGEAKKLNIRVSVLDNYIYQQILKDKPYKETNNIIETDEPWSDSVDINWLVDQLKIQINNYCILPNNYLMPLIAWIIGTYCFDYFRIFPKLCIYSPQKRCGKSTLMEILEALSFSSLMASNVSPAVIYRIIDAYRPTLFLDEADTWLIGKNVNDEMRGIINSGHTKKTARVLRCHGDQSEPKAFSTWSPMAIGMIGKPPSTIADRSLMISMRRKLKGESVYKLAIDYKDSCTPLRRCILKWSIDNMSAIKSSQYTPSTISNDRAMDNWTPLFIIAQIIGGEFLNDLNTSYLAINNEEIDDEDMGLELLKDIKNIFEQFKLDKIHSHLLVMKLISMEDRPWAEWKRGQPMTTNSLSRLLKPFNIRPKDIRDGETVRKGYNKKLFIDAFSRYI